MDPRVTMLKLAQALDLSQSTVSRALRADPRISEATRTRVIEKAEELGYRPNPLVSALMSSRKRREGSPEAGVIALITDYHDTESWKEKDVCAQEYAGILTRAEETGFRIEEFPMADFGHDGERITRTLLARGIRGVLLGFTRDRQRLGGLSLENFSVAGLSTYFREVPVNRANFHGFYNVTLAMDEIRSLGGRRIGLVVPELNNRVSGYLWSGAALDWQRRIPEIHRCPPFVAEPASEEEAFRKWLGREKPDSLLVYKLPVKTWLSKLGLRVPEDLRLAYLFRTRREMAEWPGIDGNLQRVGAAAVDLVIEGLHTHRLGAPPHPKEVLIKGEWRGMPKKAPL